uniref:Uncharacterized protein n=1 Tax=Glossina palpalis gambiensis TaxID=67801 RepID=A0A1B0C6C1_9MUSC
MPYKTPSQMQRSAKSPSRFRLMKLLGLIIGIVTISSLEAKSTLYRFVREYSEISDDCNCKPGTFSTTSHFLDTRFLLWTMMKHILLELISWSHATNGAQHN